jgi:hypothetical protein
LRFGSPIISILRLASKIIDPIEVNEPGRAYVPAPGSASPMIGVQARTPIPISPLTGPRPTTPIGILELVLGAEPTISRNRGHALLEGIEATIRSTSPTTVLGTPRRCVRRIVAQQ